MQRAVDLKRSDGTTIGRARRGIADTADDAQVAALNRQREEHAAQQAGGGSTTGSALAKALPYSATLGCSSTVSASGRDASGGEVGGG